MPVPSATLARNLAGLALATSAIVGPPAAARANDLGPRPAVAEAYRLHFAGRSGSARAALDRRLDDKAPPADQRLIREALLDICLRSRDLACLNAHLGPYLKAAATFPAANPAQERHAVRTANYLAGAAIVLMGDTAMQQKAVLAIANEDIADPALYMRRQILKARLLVALDRDPEAIEALDRALSMAATLENPQDDRLAVAETLAHAIGLLGSLGEIERAHGLYRASVGMIAAVLPPASADAIAFHLDEAVLLQEVGRVEGAGLALDVAIAALRTAELPAEVSREALAQALTLKAVIAVSHGDAAGAEAVLADHPFKARFSISGARPQTWDQATYLAARALAAAYSGRADPIAAEALAAPLDLAHGTGADQLEVYRLAGGALGGRSRGGLQAMGRALGEAARRKPPVAFGAWYRPGLVDQMLIALSLDGFQHSDDMEAVFTLFQLAGRRGASFDADALSLLAQAKDPAQRRQIHQALRMRARRDRFERDQVRTTAAKALAGNPQAALLKHGFAPRRALRNYAVALDRTNRVLLTAGVGAAGANLTDLKRFQAALGPGEAALAVTNTASGVAYLCIRRDQTIYRTGPLDIRQAQQDMRLLQSALTAGHPPSEAADIQFPVTAATRLYDGLIRPFADCLKPDDDIVWLPSLSLTGIPLAALLEGPPPKIEGGWDLAQAPWLVRRHAIAYAGSAAVVTAARSGGVRTAAPLDFLGVGDPAPSGALKDLPPLPETEPELTRSAAGFRNPTVLLRAAATEERVRDQLLGAYRYLSFATHGLVREDIPGLSVPALALTAGSGTPDDDGLLNAAEIADLNLAAAFVALSACNTANYDLAVATTELPALASAFAVAGVPATLATLWPVDSRTSETIVADVFRGVSRQRGPARALAEAQRAFLAGPPARAYLHPRFWAPFIVLGDGARADAGPAALTLASVRAVDPRADPKPGREDLAAFVDPAAGRVRVMAKGRPLFEITPPAGARIQSAAVIPQGEALLVAYAQHFGPPPQTPLRRDDYDQPVCLAPPNTWLELRDRRTGALLKSRSVAGVGVFALSVDADGRALVGGAAQDGCAARRGVVLRLDPDLGHTLLFSDDGDGDGDSAVLALGPMSRGRVLAAVGQGEVVAYDPSRAGGFARRHGARLLVLGPTGAASAPLFLDSGSDLFVEAVDAADAGDIRVRALAGRSAVVLHLSDRGR